MFSNCQTSSTYLPEIFAIVLLSEVHILISRQFFYQLLLYYCFLFNCLVLVEFPHRSSISGNLTKYEAKRLLLWFNYTFALHCNDTLSPSPIKNRKSIWIFGTRSSFLHFWFLGFQAIAWYTLGENLNNMLKMNHSNML